MPTPRSPLLVGRRDELATALRLAHAAARGEGGALLIRGEAGIGKSRLAAEIVRHARELGLVPFVGRAVEGGGAYRAPAGALAPALRRPLPDTERLRPHRPALRRLTGGADAGPPDRGLDPSVVLGEAVLALLAELGGGAVLVLEDLHWADPDTLDLVRYLAAAAHDVGVLLVLTARDDVRAPDVAALATGPGITVLPLARFGPDDVAALAAACRAGVPLAPDRVAALVRSSDGLPFLVEELLDEPDLTGARSPSRVPPTLAGLVERRLAALDPTHRRVLVTAAVVGDDPDWRLLAAVLEVEEDDAVAALAAGAAVGLLAVEEGRLSWRHALTRSAVVGTLLPPERAAVSGRAARVLAGRSDLGRRLVAADLYLAAGEGQRATDLLVELARDDAARGALRSAADLLTRAATSGHSPAAVALERVAVLTVLGRAAEALDVGEEALRSGAVRGDDHARLCQGLARAAVVAGRWAAADRLLERAGRPQDNASIVIAADAAFGRGDVERSAALARSVIDAAPAVERCRALLVLGRSLYRADTAASRSALERAATLAAEHGLTLLRIEALFALGSLEHTVGDPAAPSLALARELGERTGASTQVVQTDLLRSDAACQIDGPGAALPIALRAAERAGRLRLTALQAMAELLGAGYAGLCGDTATLSQLLAAATGRPDAPAEVPALAPLMRALPHLVQHDLAAAAETAGESVPALLGHRSAAPTPWFGLWALLRTAAELHQSRTHPAIEVLRGHHSRHAVANRAALAYADAVLAGGRGDGERAVALLRDADALLARQPWWRRLLRLQVLAAAVADGWGDPVPELRADLAVHERIGPEPLARTCRDLLRSLGVRTRRPADPTAPALRALGITAREAEVLTLVAGGLTNAEAARRLFLSTRTVDTHVARLLAKTGSGDRAGLRRWAAATDGVRLGPT